MEKRMKKRNAGFAAVCALCAIAAAGLLYAAVFRAPGGKDAIVEYVQTNQESLERFAAGLLEEPSEDAEYHGWRAACYPEARMVEFLTGGTGMGPSTTYEGFYYSEEDRPVGFQGTELDFKRDGDGWSWEEEDGDNRERTERITARWYWFQMSF